MWIAFIFQYLWDTKQLAQLKGIEPGCCELLSFFSIFGIQNNKLLDKEQITPINKKLWAAYDYHSSQSYKLFAEHLKVINKTKDFSYLTCINKLFPDDF